MEGVEDVGPWSPAKKNIAATVSREALLITRTLFCASWRIPNESVGGGGCQRSCALKRAGGGAAIVVRCVFAFACGGTKRAAGAGTDARSRDADVMQIRQVVVVQD